MAQTKQIDQLESEIKAIVAEIVESEPDKVDTDANFVKDLGMDSMMALEVLATIEKKYRIAIPEDYLTKFTDVRSTVNIVKTILTKK